MNPIDPASLNALWSSFTGLNTLTFRLSKSGVMTAYNNRAAFDNAIHVLDGHLQQRLVEIICIIDGEFMLPDMKDKMTECGWTVVVQDTGRLLDPVD